MDSHDTDDVRRQQCFDRIYDAITKAKLSNEENFDRAILTIASSALGVSVHFALSENNGHWQGCLFWGWGLLGCAVFLVLVAYQLSNRAQDVTLEKADEYYNKKNAQAIDKPNAWEHWHQRCTLFAGMCMLLGMSLLAVYFGSNLPAAKEKQMGKQGEGKNEGVRADAVVGPDGKVTAAASSPKIIQLPTNENRAASSPRIIPVPQKEGASDGGKPTSVNPATPGATDTKSATE